MEEDVAAQFIDSSRPHVVMVTNHGMHRWQVDAGLPDTGGQNVYVNQLSTTLNKLGFRVTIYNRGGYPDPVEGEMRTGTIYRNSHERLTYLEDSVKEFVRKEEMLPRVQELSRSLVEHVRSGPEPSLVISHYWDGAAVTDKAMQALHLPVPHVWVPHSLGILKREGTPPDQWADLNIDQRIQTEETLLDRVTLVGATSQAVRRVLADHHGVRDSVFLPPCVDEDHFNPDTARSDEQVFSLLTETTGLSEQEVRAASIITEVSRTDRSKRKDLLIEAFAQVVKRHPSALLAVTLNPEAGELYRELMALTKQRGIGKRLAALGSIWEYLPSLYGHTAVYCTPSRMEGFGMSIQEAAACGVPAVASSRVPFAAEYLLGRSVETRTIGSDGTEIQIGEGAIVVPAGNLDATVYALDLLLSDSELRHSMGRAAYRITIPRFTWKSVTTRFLEQVGIAIPNSPRRGD